MKGEKMKKKLLILGLAGALGAPQLVEASFVWEIAELVLAVHIYNQWCLDNEHTSCLKKRIMALEDRLDFSSKDYERIKEELENLRARLEELENKNESS